jgi:UDP-N-acetylmuramoyl-tripeptide--D-alanyl-D-alanine ligase
VRSPGSYNNDVGVPLTLFSIQPETRAAVVEIGTNAPGEIGCLTAVARPDVAIVTCVAPAHLQGLGSIEGVAREKSDLPRGVHEDGLCILNGDDANVRAMAESLSCRVEFVSTRGEADWFATEIQTVGEGTTFRLKGGRVVELPRAGMHNVYNALFVLAAAAELGVPEDDAIAALCAAKPASRRFEPKRAGGVDILDDSYNMNPESARAGLQALAGMPTKGRRIIAFGEMLELGDHSYELHQQLGTAVWRAGIDVLVAVGAGSKPIADGAIAAGMPRACVHFVDSVESAQALLLPMLRDGDRLLCKASRRVGLDRLVDALMVALSSSDRGVSTGKQTPD